VTKPCLEAQFTARVAGIAGSPEDVFGIWDRTPEEKARTVIDEIRKFIVTLQL
jgi:hypothetical protein